jgi:hypothetical protein
MAPGIWAAFSSSLPELYFTSFSWTSCIDMVWLDSPPVKKVLLGRRRTEQVMMKCWWKKTSSTRTLAVSQEKNLSPPSVLLAQKYSFFVSFITGRLRRSSSEALDTSPFRLRSYSCTVTLWARAYSWDALTTCCCHTCQGRGKQGRRAWLQEWIWEAGCVEGSSDRACGGRENVPTFNLVIDAGCGDVVQVWLENSFEMWASIWLGSTRVKQLLRKLSRCDATYTRKHELVMSPMYLEKWSQNHW